MNNYFFITSYDKISSQIITHLLNLHSDIDVKLLPDQALFPQPISMDLDTFIENNKSTSKKYVGNSYNLTAYELQNKSLIERSKIPFRRVNLMLSPVMRIRFLMHQWTMSNLKEDELIKNLENQLIYSNNTLLQTYNVLYYYKNILQVMQTKLQLGMKSNQNFIPNINFNGRLFLIALSLVIAFDTADFPTTGKIFSFENLIANEGEFIRFTQYLTNNKSIENDNFLQKLRTQISSVTQLLNSIQISPLEAWQADLLNYFLNTKLETIYGANINQSLAHFYSNFGYLNSNIKTNYTKLISLQLNSNRPAQLSAYFDNIEETAHNPNEIEVLVNVDEDDYAMRKFLDHETTNRKFTIKYIQSPKPNSFYDLWKPLNKLLTITDPSAYFLLNVSDEMFFETEGWDTILKKYIGIFPDHIFRLRVSRNKFRNYFDRWECSFAQDSIPITTQKWINIVGDWNPCFGPDSFQQLISYYLAKEGMCTYENYLREIPILDIKFKGDIPSLGVESSKKWKMFNESVDALQICQSYKMQLEARRRAILLKAHIITASKQINNAELLDLKNKKIIRLQINNQPIIDMSYKLSWFKISFENQWRKILFSHYFGGGFEMRLKPITSFIYYLKCKHEIFFKMSMKIHNKLNSIKNKRLEKMALKSQAN